MAKNSIRDYDSSSSNNSDVQSVDISEGCSPSGINNAIREVMADLADVNEGTIALESPKFDSIKDGNIKPPDASGTDVAGTATTIKGGAGTGTGAGGSIIFQTADGGSTGSSVNSHATAMTITDDGNINFTGSIKDSAGTNTALTIDSSGRVLTPARPSFSVDLTSQFNTGSTGFKMTGWTENHDIGSCWDNTNSKFVAPVDGIYQFNYTGLHQATSGAANWVRVELKVEGSNVVDCLSDRGTYDTYQRLSFSVNWQLSANDEVELHASSNSSSGFVYAGNSYTVFGGYLVG